MNERGKNMDQNQTRLKRITLAAVFAALIFAGTFLIKIPIPATGGYVHPGDALVILAGIMLGKTWGFLAAGLGSALADLAGGYGVYIPATFIIKAFAALLAAVLFEGLRRRLLDKKLLIALLCGLSDVIMVPFGYLAFESVLYGPATALVAILPNLFQAIFGLIVAGFLYPVIARISKRME